MLLYILAQTVLIQEMALNQPTAGSMNSSRPSKIRRSIPASSAGSSAQILNMPSRNTLRNIHSPNTLRPNIHRNTNKPDQLPAQRGHYRNRRSGGSAGLRRHRISHAWIRRRRR